MRVQSYNAYSGMLVVTVASTRPQEAPSLYFTSATIQEDYAAQVRGVMREYKHVGAESLQFPEAQRLQTYFPTSGGSPLYAIRQLSPAGSPRDIDAEWMLEIMRIRYEFALMWLPPAHTASEIEAEAMERHLEYAVKKLFEANGVIPRIYIPGENGIRPAEGTTVDIVCEMGPATARSGVDIPQPT